MEPSKIKVVIARGKRKTSYITNLLTKKSEIIHNANISIDQVHFKELDTSNVIFVFQSRLQCLNY